MADNVIANVETGEVQRRPLAAAELAQRDKDTADALAREKSDADAKAKSLADEKSWRDAIAAATTLEALKAAVLGTNLAVVPDVRPKTAP